MSLNERTAVDPVGGGFYESTPAAIFSPEQFDADETLMIATAEEFCRREVLPIVERLDRQEDGLMVGLIRKAGQLGLCGVDSPEAFGGLGLSKNLAARILEFMSLNGSMAVTYGITSGISQVGLSLFGTSDQKAEYLPRLASGEWIGAYALSEPNAGSDALSATTRADRNGDRYVLNGAKMWISNAKWADLFLVMAKVDGERFSAFLVERGFPGVSVGPEEHKLGLKGSSTARLILDNVEAPVRNLLHQEGLGHHVAFNALNIGRFKLSSMSIGPCRDAMEHAARYAQDRRQFGKPIASFGLIRQKFAMMASLFFAAESMIYRTGAMIDAAFTAWGGDVDGNREAAEEYAIECSACKVFATEAQSFIVDEALQVFGGYGFTEEFPMARHFRDARVSRIYEGTNEINRVFLSDRLKRRIASGRVSSNAVGDSFVSELAGRAMEFCTGEAGPPPSPPPQAGEGSRLGSPRTVGQIENGALSDLLMLSYAEQSARLRALATRKEHHAALHRALVPWVNARAAEAYQRITGVAVQLPAVDLANLDELGARVVSGQGFAS